MAELLRVYLDPAEIGTDGYPHAWHRRSVRCSWRHDALPAIVATENHPSLANLNPDEIERIPAIKDLVREHAGHRCERCGHPYRKGEHGRGEWSPCDERCTHDGPVRGVFHDRSRSPSWDRRATLDDPSLAAIEAQWRILTVHHINAVKHDCRWWNLAALCQRCHLTIQGRVLMERVYPFEHSDWFKPHAAGWYAAAYLGEELTREETVARLDELLALERVAGIPFAHDRQVENRVTGVVYEQTDPRRPSAHRAPRRS